MNGQTGRKQIKVELVMLGWNGWPLGRIFDLIVGVGFLMLFIQVTLFHFRQNFRHWSMWIPVLATPVIGVLLIVYSFYAVYWLQNVLAVLLIVGGLAGMFGSFMHIRGVGNRVGGYERRNFL